MFKTRIIRYNKNIHAYIKNVVLNSVASSPLCPLTLRKVLYRIYGHKISNVFSNCFLGEGPGILTMGKGTYCNHCSFFDLGDNITIGENCSVAMRVSFINGTHLFGTSVKRGGKVIQNQ